MLTISWPATDVSLLYPVIKWERSSKLFKGYDSKCVQRLYCGIWLNEAETETMFTEFCHTSLSIVNKQQSVLLQNISDIFNILCKMEKSFAFDSFEFYQSISLRILLILSYLQKPTQTENLQLQNLSLDIVPLEQWWHQPKHFPECLLKKKR